tara:strand:+ start:166 stop:504 length:339 start_codon:yes stop_codon:yes gene_type:complete
MVMSVLTSLIKTLTKKHLAKAASKTKKDKRKGASSRRDPRKADQQETNQKRAGYPSEDIGTPREASTMKTRIDARKWDSDRRDYRESTDRGRKASSNLRETTDRRKPKDRRK